MGMMDDIVQLAANNVLRRIETKHRHEGGVAHSCHTGAVDCIKTLSRGVEQETEICLTIF